MTYRVHRFDIKMTADSAKLEQFLNGLEGEVVAVVPNVTLKAFWVHQVDFVLVVEKLPSQRVLHDAPGEPTSSTIVTGPSVTSETSILAPKTPV